MDKQTFSSITFGQIPADPPSWCVRKITYWWNERDHCWYSSVAYVDDTFTQHTHPTREDLGAFISAIEDDNVQALTEALS